MFYGIDVVYFNLNWLLFWLYVVEKFCDLIFIVDDYIVIVKLDLKYGKDKFKDDYVDLFDVLWFRKEL